MINPGLGGSGYGNLFSPGLSGAAFKPNLDVSRYPLDKSYLDTFQTTSFAKAKKDTEVKTDKNNLDRLQFQRKNSNPKIKIEKASKYKAQSKMN